MLRDPLTTLSATGAMQTTGMETLAGIAVERYAGRTDLNRWLSTLAAFLGVDDACVRFFAGVGAAVSGYPSAALAPVSAEVWLGQQDGFPYRIRLTANTTRGDQMIIDARLTPSATGFAILPPGAP